MVILFYAPIRYSGDDANGKRVYSPGEGKIDRTCHPLHPKVIMSNALRVLIVDEQTRSRQSLRALLATDSAISEIYEARNDAEALQAIDQFAPALVLIDVRNPDADGVVTIQLIKKHAPHIQVVVLSLYSSCAAAALSAGADAFVSKGEPPDKLLTTLQTLMPKQDSQ